MKKQFLIKTIFLSLLVTPIIATDSFNTDMMLGVRIEEPKEPAPPVELSPFEKELEQFRANLVEFEYTARRYSAYFTPLEASIMQALQHTMQLADKTKGFSTNSLEGREAFKQLNVPIKHISMTVRNSPVLKHAVYIWDNALVNYQNSVRYFTNTDTAPGNGFDFNDPVLKQLQASTKELTELVQHFEYQIKNDLPMVNLEAEGLIGYISAFSIYTNEMHTYSLNFISERYQFAETLKKATKVSKQINALLLYNPMPYLTESWQFIRSKANEMRIQFETLMHD